MKNTQKRNFWKCAKEKKMHKRQLYSSNRPKTNIKATRAHRAATQAKTVGGGATQGAAAPRVRPTPPCRLSPSILAGASMLRG